MTLFSSESLKGFSKKFLFIAFALTCICTSRTKNEREEQEEKQDVSDWFIQQRIYPEGKMNYAAYNEALQSVISERAAAHSTTLPTWQFAGPTNVGGRVVDIEMHASDQQTIYVGAASGGVFKSSDQGVTWNPIFDQNSSLSIGDIAIAPSNANTIYVGTGEPNNGRGSVTYDGQGIFKSTNAGASWTSVGLAQGRTTGRIAINPTDPNTVFVAAMGDLFGTGPDRGVYKTTNGGTTWTQVLYVNDSTGACDVCIDPNTPTTIYASTWTRVRRPTIYNYGGTGSNIYKSTNGGTTWTILTNGIPASNANVGRISIGISASSPGTLYATYSDPIGAFIGMYKTTNGGTSWALVGGNSFLLSNLSSSQFFWGGKVTVDPTTPNVLYIADFSMWKSTDGGQNWMDIGQSYHVDNHTTYVHPANPSLLLEGSDGGFFISQDAGASWYTQQDIPITQFYTCEIDNTDPTNLYGGMQDNGTAYTPTGNVYDWQSVYGGDGFYAVVDPQNPANRIFEYQYGGLSGNTSGINFGENSAWNTPIVLNPLNSASVYTGRQSLYKSISHGNGWSAISPDLTGGVMTGNLVFHTITSISNSRVDTNIIWVGCDDGTVQVTTNSGGSWTNVSAGLPVRWITRVAADPVVTGRAYVTVSGFRWHEYLPHLLVTNNYGSTWTDISNNLPQAPVNDIIIDPGNLNVLYAATDLGVYYSVNLGTTWQSAGMGIPLVPITDLLLHVPTGQLVAATYGRGMYTLSVSQLLGTNEQYPTLADVNVFPNPVQNEFTVSLNGITDAAMLTVFSAEGKIVLTKELKNKNEVVQRGDLPSGIYFYRISSGKKNASGKLIFQ